MRRPLQEKFFLQAVGVMLVTPGMCLAGYFFLRDREKLEVFGGKSLWMRTAICTGCYLILWALYAYVHRKYGIPTEVWQLFIILPSMLALGSLAALGCYELDFGS